MHSTTTRLVGLCLLPLALAAACRAVAPLLPDMNVHAQIVQATLLMLPRWLMLLGVAWCLRVGLRYRSWPIPVALALVWLVLAGIPGPFGGEARASAGTRLLFANVNAYTEPPDPEGLGRAIAGHEPDVVIVVEKRAIDIPGMERVADNFDVPVSRPSHHSAAWCAGECEAQVTEEFGSDTSRMPLVVIRLARETCILGLHAPPPVPINPTGILPHVARIAGDIADGRLARDLEPCRQGDGALVVGDLNHVPGSRPYWMLRDRGLRDALRWRGVWAASWPAGGGWPNTPFYQLDQVLVGDVKVDDVRQVRLPGADHKALVLDVGR